MVVVPKLRVATQTWVARALSLGLPVTQKNKNKQWEQTEIYECIQQNHSSIFMFVCVFDSICHILYYFNLKQQIFAHFARFSSITHNTNQIKLQNRTFKQFFSSKGAKFAARQAHPLNSFGSFCLLWVA